MSTRGPRCNTVIRQGKPEGLLLQTSGSSTLQEELFDELRGKGFNLFAGALGENITTRGIDLVSLPEYSRLL